MLAKCYLLYLLPTFLAVLLYLLVATLLGAFTVEEEGSLPPMFNLSFEKNDCFRGEGTFLRVEISAPK